MRRKPVSDWKEKTDTACLLGDWANQYLDFAGAKYSDKTYREKKAMFKRFFKSVDAKKPVSSLTSKQVLNFVVQQHKERSGYAANKDRKNLVAAWNWGTKYLDPPLTGLNPCLVEKMPEVRRPRYVPPEDDFWAIYKVAEGQDRVMLLTLLYLAARRGEVFALTWSDVDFVNSRVRLKTRKRRDGTLEYDVLPMIQELREALRWWWEHRPIKDSPYVFLCLDKHELTKEHYGKPFQYRLCFMKRLCEKASVERFGFHAIRHLSATILYNNGVDVSVIQAILRHKSATTTDGYLRTLGLEALRKPLEKGFSKPVSGEVIPFEEKQKKSG